MASRRKGGSNTDPPQPPVSPPEPFAPPDEPFAPLEDDPAAALANEYNDPDRVDLRPHMPAPIGGAAPPQFPFGGDPFGPGGYSPAPPTTGRPTSPPIWASAHLHETVSQLRVWKRVNGRPVLVGECDAKINTEEFIRRFYAVMPQTGEGEASYIIRPINYDGVEVGTEIALPPISEHHTVLQQERSRRAAASAPGSPGYVPPAPDLSPLQKLIERQQDAYEARIRQLEEAARAERERAVQLQEKTAEERAELAARTAMSVEAITERMLKLEGERAERLSQTESERNRHAQEGMAALFTQVTTLQQQTFQQLAMQQQSAAEREREAYDRRVKEEADRRERERQEAEDRRQRDQQEWERKWEREKEEARRRDEQDRRDREDRLKAAEDERQRQHEARMKEMELSAVREREHAERMIRLHTDKGESVEGIVQKGVSLLERVGLKPTDLLDMVRSSGQGEDGPNPLIEVGARALSDVVKAVAEIAKSRQQAAAAADQPLYPPGAGTPWGYPPGAYPPGAYPQGVPALPPPGMAPPPGYVGGPQGPTPQRVAAQGGAGGYAGAAAPAAAPAEQPAPNCTLPMPTQRAARVAIRRLVQQLRSAPEEQWGALVAQAVQMENAIYHYASQVTIRYAVKEGGADDVLAQRIIAAIDASGLVPQEVPRG